MQHQATSRARLNAKALRKAPTDAERRLWHHLRMQQLGVRFRRQHPLGPFVADFACLDPRIVVEVDGSQHVDQAAYDRRRDAWLSERGFRVLRVWADQVMRDPGAVVDAIRSMLPTPTSSAPTPALPRRGRESRGTP